MIVQKNILIDGQHGKPIVADAYWAMTGDAKPIVIFAHGFKGFKDWGTWERIGEELVAAGFVFVKFNFSHNGTTPENPSEFEDLEAFGNNNYEIELDDLGSVLDWLATQTVISQEAMDLENISLIGHSRGGGVAIIKAYEDARIKNLITWASVGGLDWMFKSEMLEKWATEGVHFVVNGRTKQSMPLYYQWFENFKANEERLSTKTALENFQKPHLIVQGTNDVAVSVTDAQKHKAWNPQAELVLIADADHVFGGSHPFEGQDLPPHTMELVESTISFLNRIGRVD